MSVKKILIIITGLTLLLIALYYYGFISAFRNFSGSDSWRSLKEYQLYAKKEVVEKNIYALGKRNFPFISIADSSLELTNNGFFMISIIDSRDTIAYSFRIPGNDSTWNSSKISEILLMRIENKEFDISYSTLQKVKNKTFQKMLHLFESRFIDSLKNIRNPD